jgi:Tfp pilus assembly ATPase PilU
MSLSDADDKLYRLYAVGKVSYEDALRQAQSVVQLRRALLQFDQDSRWKGKDGADEPKTEK